MNSGRQRVPFFERPAPPHDWRWVVGLIGKSFITLGVLMFAFVAYQLWGTGIQTAQAQHDLDRQFQEQLQGTTTSPSTTTVPDTAPLATLDTAPVTTVAAPTTSTIPLAPPGALVEGSAVAKLKIPSIGLDWTVIEGVDVPDLKKGPGHFPETPLPGQLGNAAIAGHRTTYGAPFFDLDKVKVGDLIEVDTVTGAYTYQVTGSTVVRPSEYAAVIPTIDPEVATLTLATCTPAYTARDRLIILATLVPDTSAQVYRPASTAVPVESTVTPTLPTESVPDTTPTTTSVTATTVAAAVTLDQAAPDTDAFAQGWFEDASAVPQVILWGLALVAVVMFAWYIGRHVNKLWVSVLVGAVPFVVVLYFFFENVNRLLPPSI